MMKKNINFYKNNKLFLQKKWLWVFLFIVIIFGFYLNRSYAFIYNHIGDEKLVSSLSFLQTPTHISVVNSVNNQQLKIVALGDSLTTGVGVSTQEASYPFLFASLVSQKQSKSIYLTNIGVPGALSADVLSDQLDQAIAVDPDIVTLCIGVNDMHNFVSQKEFRANLESIIDSLSSKTNAQIVVMTIPFIGSDDLMNYPYRQIFNYKTQKYNETIKAVAQQKQVKLVDIYSETITPFYNDKTMYSTDWFHPAEKGYNLMASILYASLYR